MKNLHQIGKKKGSTLTELFDKYKNSSIFGGDNTLYYTYTPTTSTTIATSTYINEPTNDNWNEFRIYARRCANCGQIISLFEDRFPVHLPNGGHR